VKQGFAGNHRHNFTKYGINLNEILGDMPGFAQHKKFTDETVDPIELCEHNLRVFHFFGHSARGHCFLKHLHKSAYRGERIAYFVSGSSGNLANHRQTVAALNLHLQRS